MGLVIETESGEDTWMEGLAPWGGLKLQVVRTLRWEVLHHGGVGLKVGSGDTWTLLLAPWGWVLKLVVEGHLDGRSCTMGVGVETAGGEDT